MSLSRTLGAAAIAVSCAAVANADVFPTFVLDTSASLIDIDQSGCTFLSCGTLTGTFAAGADSFSWTPTSPGDSTYVGDFFNWSVSGSGFEGFSVDVTLAFTSPDAVSGGGSGSGGYATFRGIITGGFLNWTSFTPAVFAQGSTLDIAFDNIATGGLGGSTQSGATFTGNPAVATVPVPASLSLLGVGVAAFGLFRRRRQRAA